MLSIIHVFADYHVSNGLLVMPGYGLCYPPDFSADKHCQFQGHSVVGDFHLSVLDSEFDFGCD